jgi:hypothetical protein
MAPAPQSGQLGLVIKKNFLISPVLVQSGLEHSRAISGHHILFQTATTVLAKKYFLRSYLNCS